MFVFRLYLETRCVIYMGTQLPWAHAQATCIDMESELLSYRTDSTVSLIYQLTATAKRRKRQVHIASDKSVVWTSGHAVETSSRKYSSAIIQLTNMAGINFLCFSGSLSMG